MKTEKYRVRRPLAVRLIVMISLIVLVSAAAITALATLFFADDTRARAEDQNLVLNELVSYQAESEIRYVWRSALALLDLFRDSEASFSASDSRVAGFFSRNPAVLYVGLGGTEGSVNARLLSSFEADRSSLESFIASSKDSLSRALSGETILLNASPSLGFGALALFAPYRDYGREDSLVVVFSTEALQSIVSGNASSETVIVASDGTVLVHPDSDLARSGASLANEPAVAKTLASPNENLQFRFADKKGAAFVGAFHKVSLGQFSVVSTIPTADLYSAAFGVARQNLYITGIVLLFSVLAVWFFARSVTRPVLELVGAAKRIEGGEYEIPMESAGADELGLLKESFAAMGRGLAERERIKETFGKFVNRDIAEKALTGKLALGGVRRTATIFFSDIRSFTAISEKLAPEAVVEFLNDYMTRMVDCIERTHGVVDKFIGDAIMGVWGAPVSRGSPEQDALECVTAMLMMRKALVEFNRDRGTPEKPVIRIGCGANTGPVLAGQIGSAHRMEYTVIGDSVNLASRIEALNKPFATDILISGDTFALLRDRAIVEPMPPIKVKGKTGVIKIYALINLKGMEGPGTLAEVRSLLGLREPSAPVAPDAEEVKYEILEN